ncbi:MAG: hypothetical protein ACTHQE_18005 [Thermomicrobiales bacterium]
MAGVDHHIECEDASNPQRSVVLLLDAATGGEDDLERYVSRLLAAACGDAPESGMIVSQVAIPQWCERESWRTIVVPDVARVAAALGVLALPAVVLTGAIEESQQQLDAIVRRLDRYDGGRVSGALSSGDLR